MNVTLMQLVCDKCEHKWFPRTDNPRQCPHCKSIRWRENAKRCPQCNDTKPLSDFGKTKGGYRSWCKKCGSIDSMEYYDKNRVKIIKHRQKHVIQSSVDGKRRWITGVFKRTRPENNVCEICNKASKQISYHHWNDDKPSWGVWVCHACHSGCNFMEKQNLVNNYNALKKLIEDNYHGEGQESSEERS